MIVNGLIMTEKSHFSDEIDGRGGILSDMVSHCVTIYRCHRTKYVRTARQAQVKLPYALLSRDLRNSLSHLGIQ